ncbi:PE/PPE C-terminal domain-containing protein, partial [Mycobacterium tuberculosis]|uniref:PE/PPE C-terminal domain-containing protein n=6 Tax=Mycobacterium tuberculosis TaxID=1773 RepID=UPI001F30FE5C
TSGETEMTINNQFDDADTHGATSDFWCDAEWAGLRGPVAAGLGRAALVGYLSVPQGWTEANQANLAAGTEAEPNQALGWLPMQDIDAAAEAAAQPSHALGWLPRPSNAPALPDCSRAPRRKQLQRVLSALDCRSSGGSEPIAPVHHCTGMGFGGRFAPSTPTVRTAQTDGTPLARMWGVFEMERK